MIDKKNRGGLIYLSMHVVQLAGQCMDVVHCIIPNEKHTETFKEASTEGIIAMKVIKSIMTNRVNNCNQFKSNLLLTCLICKLDRKTTIARHLINTVFNLGSAKLATFLT